MGGLEARVQVRKEIVAAAETRAVVPLSVEPLLSDSPCTPETLIHQSTQQPRIRRIYEPPYNGLRVKMLSNMVPQLRIYSLLITLGRFPLP